MYSKAIKFLDSLAKEYGLDRHKSEDFTKLMIILSSPEANVKYEELLAKAASEAK